MEILKISQTYDPFLAEGGRPTKVKAIASKLAARGHHVVVLTADLGLHKYSDAVENLERCRWGSRSEASGVETVYLCSIAHYRTLTLNPDVIGFCRERIPSTGVAHIYGLYACWDRPLPISVITITSLHS